MGKQKTAIRAGALIDDAKKWSSIDWNYARRQVRRLEVRIAKAVKENRGNSELSCYQSLRLIKVSCCKSRSPLNLNVEPPIDRLTKDDR